MWLPTNPIWQIRSTTRDHVSRPNPDHDAIIFHKQPTGRASRDRQDPSGSSTKSRKALSASEELKTAFYDHSVPADGSSEGSSQSYVVEQHGQSAQQEISAKTSTRVEIIH